MILCRHAGTMCRHFGGVPAQNVGFVPELLGVPAQEEEGQMTRRSDQSYQNRLMFGDEDHKTSNHDDIAFWLADNFEAVAMGLCNWQKGRVIPYPDLSGILVAK